MMTTIAMMTMTIIWTIWTMQRPAAAPSSFLNPVNAPPLLATATTTTTTTTTTITTTRDAEQKILVVYSGPLRLPDLSQPPSDERLQTDKLYLANLDFFIRHGVDCQRHDTVLILGEAVARQYQARMDEWNRDCRGEHHVKILTREPVCYDMESVRLVLHTGAVPLDVYDYLIYVNCGTTGPAPQNTYSTLPWTQEFTRRFTDRIKMVGLSYVCENKRTHLQSMVYALDRTGIDIIRKSDAVFDCRGMKDEGEAGYENVSLIISRYEIGMSKTIMDAGFQIYAILSDTTFDKVSRQKCKGGDDIWLTSRLKAIYGHMPSLKEVFFFKTSRYLPPDIKQQIGYEGRTDWEWK
jgi:hypothetical protein